MPDVLAAATVTVTAVVDTAGSSTFVGAAAIMATAITVRLVIVDHGILFETLVRRTRLKAI